MIISLLIRNIIRFKMEFGGVWRIKLKNTPPSHQIDDTELYDKKLCLQHIEYKSSQKNTNHDATTLIEQPYAQHYPHSVQIFGIWSQIII